MFATALQVALGGALGSVARYLLGAGFLRVLGPGFPWATFAINIAGSFLMGVAVVVLGHFSANRLAPFLMTGVLGGFTTFSAFSLDAAVLWQRGEGLPAAGYVLGSVALALAGLSAGMALTRSLLA